MYMTISEDGFIAGLNDETPWSDESWESFQNFVRSCDVVLLGRRTFEIMRQQDEFISGPRYVVVTRNPDADTGEFEKLQIDSAEDMPKANKVGVIGGGDLNEQLIKLGVIDEIILDEEAVKLGQGFKLFGQHEVEPQLKLLDSERLGSRTIQRHYKVVN